MTAASSVDPAGRLTEIGNWILMSAPPFPKIRANPTYMGWDSDLHELGRAEGLESISPDLENIIRDGMKDPTSLNQFLEEKAPNLPYDVFYRASREANAALQAKPLGAFFLALIALLGFAKQNQGRYRDDPSLLYNDWRFIPYVCARASLEAGALHGAKMLVEHIYQVLDSTRPQRRSYVLGEMETFRLLGRDIERRIDLAVNNLADEFRDSCQPGTNNFRAEAGAIAWSLGMVPESMCLRASSRGDYVPSRRFFRQLVRQSMACLQEDPLLQYIWLDMKDRGPFNLRDHESLFTLINNRYEVPWFMMVEAVTGPLGKLFARNLIDVFRSQVDRKVETAYFKICGNINRLPELILNPEDLMRINGLSELLCDADPEAGQLRADTDLWNRLSGDFSQRRWDETIIFSPDIHSQRGDIPMYYFIDDGIQKGKALKLINRQESYRSRALYYWLKVTPPMPDPEEEVKLAEYIEVEKKLIERLRGAYFEFLLPNLPESYWYYGGSATERADPASAPKHFKQLEESLQHLHDQMDRVSPTYGARRVNPQPDDDSLLRALSAHTGRTANTIISQQEFGGKTSSRWWDKLRRKH